MDKNKKCIVCQEKNAWIISPTICKIPIYCRKCYCEKILKLKYLNHFCDKCGHKINTCQKSGSKKIICFGCEFKRRNVHKNSVKNFYNYITSPIGKIEGHWSIMTYMREIFVDMNARPCCFIYSREHRC